MLLLFKNVSLFTIKRIQINVKINADLRGRKSPELQMKSNQNTDSFGAMDNNLPISTDTCTFGTLYNHNLQHKKVR